MMTLPRSQNLPAFVELVKSLGEPDNSPAPTQRSNPFDRILYGHAHAPALLPIQAAPFGFPSRSGRLQPFSGPVTSNNHYVGNLMPQIPVYTTAPFMVSAPAPAPISVPVSAPISAPVAPVSAPVAPVSAPVAPVSAPVAPVSAPVAPISPGTSSSGSSSASISLPNAYAPAAHSQSLSPASASVSPNTEGKNDQEKKIKTPVKPNEMVPRKQHICEVCSRSFTTSGHLARHNRTHTGERNYECPFETCNARFSRQDNCMQHFKTHSESRTGLKRGRPANKAGHVKRPKKEETSVSDRN